MIQLSAENINNPQHSRRKATRHPRAASAAFGAFNAGGLKLHLCKIVVSARAEPYWSIYRRGKITITENENKKHLFYYNRNKKHLFYYNRKRATLKKTLLDKTIRIWAAPFVQTSKDSLVCKHPDVRLYVSTN